MPDSEDRDSAQPLFLTTRWSVVLEARDKVSPGSARALESLCKTYWYPLYVYVRRQGHSAHDAQDLTQAFFERLLEKDYLRAAAQEKGRFRTFLIVAAKRFLLNEWDKVRRQKRGGGQAPVSLDAADAENRYILEPAEPLPADRAYERRWALTLLEQAMGRLRADYEESGRGKEFEHLKACLAVDGDGVSYGALAAELQMSEGAARVALHRLRKRFRQLFREEITGTVSSPAEVGDEVRYVVSILGRD